MDFFERMRAKPRAEKNRYAFATAFVVTALVGTFWALSLPAKLMPTSITADESKEESGFGDLFTSVESHLGNIIDSLQPENPQEPEVSQSAPALEEIDQEIDQDEGSPKEERLTEDFGTTTASTSTEISAQKPEQKTVLIATSTGQKSEQ